MTTTSLPVNTNASFARVKSSVFIDTVKFELMSPSCNSLKAILRDDHNIICGTFESDMAVTHHELTWQNLNHLPYGVYTLELHHGEDEMTLRLVKRV